jgi:site-specific DNA-methyltransferase (adenine-specific)
MQAAHPCSGGPTGVPRPGGVRVRPVHEAENMTPYYQDDAVTIYHADCREVLPVLEPESVTLLWTDPPYGHGNHVDDLNQRLNGHRGILNQPIANDGADEMRAVVDAMLRLALPLLRPECCCCCCCGGGGPRPTFAWLAERMDRDGFSFFHSVIWDKVNPGLGWRYRRQHEMVMVAHRTGGKLAWAEGQEAVSNVVVASPPRNRLHPNQKPHQLVSGFIARHSAPGDLVLDPFMGAGTTLRAAKALGRPSIGVDVEERYCEMAALQASQEVLDLFTTNEGSTAQMAENGTISVRDALTKIAAEASGPLTASEIVERALAQPLGLKGKTPAASVQAQLYTAAKKGELFKRTGRGTFEAIAA